ncbi:gliding motility protein [Streptomyces sp. NPDC058662]|uniref:gliding motility protein n=1 Tax=Streptomyces sp. NPDC058662 TaxID=3346583 RepID=UPI003654D7E3
MGVFDRFFRRKDEAATEEVAAEAVTAESAGSGEAEGGAVAAGGPAEAVEIPKQQSADVAADSEAGEGART